MAKKKKPRPARADELFEYGPLRVGRFGKNIVWQVNWPESAFEEFQQRAIKRLPEITNEIDQLVSKIREAVRVLPAHKLLHRAWWEMAAKHIGVHSEVEIDTEHAVSMRMIDYLQSMVAAVPPASQQKNEATDEEWKALREDVGSLFRKLNIEYQICRTAYKKANDANFNQDFEEFEIKAQLHWCNIRGARYQVHEFAFLNDLFLPHSKVLEDAIQQ